MPKFRVIFRPKSEIQSFFPSKIKKKKRSTPKLGVIFRPISQIHTFEGGLFSYGGAIFHFSQKIGLKNTKNMRFCILLKPMGGARAPPAPPWLRYCTQTVVYAGFKKKRGGARNFKKFEKSKDQNKKLFHPKSVRFFAQNWVKSKKKGFH